MNRAGSSLGLWLLHVGSVCLALALVATFAAGRAVAFVNDDGDRPAEVIQIPSQETEIADDIHLAVGYVSVVKVPEEIASVSLTDATNFKAEIVPADGREARLTLLNTQADQGSVVIGTRQGHLMTLRLVNISAQPGRRTVDLFVEYQGDFSSLQRSVVYGFPRSVAQREKYAEPAASSPTQAMPLKHENAAVASTVTNPQAPPQNTSLPAAKPSPAPAPETAALAKPVLAPSIPASAAPTQPTVKPAVAVSGSTSTKPSATVVTPQPAESFPQMGSLGREHAQVLRRPLPPESQSQKQESQGRQGDRPQEDQTRSKQKQNRPEPDQPAPPEAVRAQKTLPQDQPALRTIALRDEPKPREISSSSNLDPGLGTGISPSLFIGPGDLLEISVYGAAELSQKIRVSGSGDIMLPLINAVHVSGLTAEQAQKRIEAKLIEGQFMIAPSVAVFLSEYATQGASVLGEVSKPGVYPVLGARRLFDLISLAGGFTSKAGNVVSITHRGEVTPVRLQISKDPVKASEANVPVLPSDTILVSKAGIVYVIGNVNKPGGFVLDKDSGLTVLQSIALAEGTRPSSKMNSTVLIRKTEHGTQQIAIPLKKIMESKSPDLALLPDDVVFIPNSASAAVVKRGAESILQVATGAAIYRF